MELTLIDILLGILKIFSFVLPVLISVALLVYLERKVLGAVQLRRGPNVVGPFGILQSFADVIKLITKENQKKCRFSPHQILFASTMTKRNFILLGVSQGGSPSSVKLYQSSSVLGLLADIREVPPLAVDDWGHINACLLANRS